MRLAKDWFTHANRDLAASERLLAQPAFPAEAAFHSHQAIEKTLKGWLAWHDLPFARTHDLDELLAQCATVDSEVLSFRVTLAPLMRYAVEVRYPGSGFVPSVDEAQEASDLARQIIGFAHAHLPPEVWP